MKGGKIVNDIKSRMVAQGITQVEMIFELQKRGTVVQPPELSQILSGVYTYPKAKRVLDECDRILKEHEIE
jgi:hypothetical protein